jgi:hypothetical protein
MTIEVKNQLDLTGVEGLSDEAKAQIAELYNQTVVKELTPLKNKNDELIQREKDAKAKADEESRLALEAQQATELEKATKEKDVASLLEVIERHKQETADLRASIAQQDKETAISKVTGSFLERIIDDRAAKHLMKSDFVNRLDHRDGHVVVLNEQGALSGMSVNELAQSMLNDPANKAYVRAEVGSGGSANGSAGRGTAANQNQMTRADFDRMQPAEQGAFMSTGGAVVD